jgi:predicted ATPase
MEPGLGREFDPSMVAALCEDIATEVPALIEKALDAGLIARVARSPLRRFVFAHDLVRDACYREFTPAERADIHLRTATLLDARDAAAVDPAERARHRLAALPHGDARLAADSMIQAGRRALHELAYEEATRWFEQAIAVVEAAPEAASTESRIEAAVFLGESQLRSGEMVAGQSSCRRAAPRDRRRGSGAALRGRARPARAAE